MNGSWIVHKFGGTSLADAERYRRAAELVLGEGGQRRAVVVSAMAGVTDDLIALVELARRRDAVWTTTLRALRRRQLELIGELLGKEAADGLVATLESDFNDIEDVLRALWLIRSRPARAHDLIAGYGELWSAQVLAAHLRAIGEPAQWLDARRVLTVDPGELAPVVDWERSRAAAAERLAEIDARTVVIPGFVAVDREGLQVTLGRNGSDYSASIFAALLDAEMVQIWTDVDGVLSADPRQVPEAHVLDVLSYDEAMELAYFGAKVIHPATMAPLVTRAIPIRIRNARRPEAPGTTIRAGAPATALPARGLATIDGMALINLEGTGMIGVPGIAERLFGALREAGVSVVVISQGSSEHSICYVVPEAQADGARAAVERAFFSEIHHGQIQRVEVERGCAVLAVVGDGMAGQPGIAAKFFGALGQAGINVRAIAQGSSERNISAVIDAASATRALRAVHAGFYLSEQTLSVGLLGSGLVGGTLLDQLAGERERLRRERQIDLRVRGIATSRRMLLGEPAVVLDDWRAALEAQGEPLDLQRFVEHVRSDAVPHAVLVDCTASGEIAERYVEWAEGGLHLITPNKRAGTQPLPGWQRLRDALRDRRRHYLYETTVGAGLPILQTLRDLIETGDTVLGIEGILSGTLSYLFNAFDGSRPFSAVVREARELGYTEPDPRDDLLGTDVARKVVILAREIGRPLELEDVTVESLVPEALARTSAETFLERLDELDGPMLQRLEQARAAGKVLRYVGTIDPQGDCGVRLGTYPADHPFAGTRPTDNVVLFRTGRYRDNPLVVQGPGAGPDVTAAGVFADLLRLATYLGGSR